MTKVHTFCRLCEPACALIAEVSESGISELRPDKEHPVHKGFACHKGLSFLDVHYDPDRLDYPLRKAKGKNSDGPDFVRISWDEAFQEIAGKLQAIQERYGPSAIAAYTGNPASYTTATYQKASSIISSMGCRMKFSAGTQDCSAKFAASEGIYGSLMFHPIPDLLHTDYFLSIGSNPMVSHMSFVHVSDPMEKLKDIRRRGGTIRFVNPRIIESSTPETGDVLLIRPDTDFYFLAGVLHEMLFEIGFDRAAVEARSRNIDGLLKFVSAYPPDRVAPVTGIGADTIRQVAKEFTDAPRASIHMSTGVNMGRQGALAYWMLNMISLVTGNLGRQGGNVYSPGFFPMAKFIRKKTDNPYFDSPHGEIRLIGQDLPATLLPDMIVRDEDPIRALIVLAGNPVLSLAGGDRLREAMMQLDLIVVIDIFRTATGEMADYILPATDWLEHEDINSLQAAVGAALEPYVQYTPAVEAPKGERRDDWWILARIAQEMGKPTMLDDPDPNPLEKIEKLLAESGLSINQLKSLPCQTAVLPPINPDDLFEIGIQHPDGLVDCCPVILHRGFERAEALLGELQSESPDQLKLITRRTNYMMNSWLHNVSRFKGSVHQINPLWINPEDAAKLDLYEGDRVEVYNENGAIDADLVFDTTLRRGVVSMSHGWGHRGAKGLRIAQKHHGVNVNQLAPTGPGSYDTLSNQTHMTGLNVSVRRLEIES